MWDFVAPEDEQTVMACSGGVVEYRPDRMALGCSSEMIQEKISDNAKKNRLEKLLKRRGEYDNDDNMQANGKFKSVSDDEEVFKSALVVKKIIAKPDIPNIVSSQTSELTKSQKKRLKKKQSDMQKKLLH